MKIDVRNLTKTFGALRANDGITLSFAAGKIHGVLGENGAGKSTLMKLLSGFLRRDAGEIRLDGTPARINTPAAALQAGIGMVHQDPLDVPAFTALENFYCASPRAAMPNLAAARRMLLDLAARLGFCDTPDAPIASLTVGQRQQLEIMRLLACGARVLILDEPTTGITAAQASALFAALRRLAAEGKTILFVSHKLEEVAELCDTVSVLRAGKVMGEGQMLMPQPQARLLELMFGPQGEESKRLQDAAQAPDLIPLPSLQVPGSAPVTTPVWKLEGVSLREGTLALHNLSLEIRPGTVTGLAGLDGSGQQLLLRLLSGRLRPVAGRLRLNGEDVTGAGAERFRQAGVQHLPADRLVDGMVGALSLSDHIVLQNHSAWRLNRSQAQLDADVAIAAYNIKGKPGTPIVALSGGNQQRAMLALLPEHCSGLLLEQPTRGLDVASARGVWQRLLERRTQGTAIVFASADLDELLAYSDYLLVFCGGKVCTPLLCNEVSSARLAELIGGVGLVAMTAA